MCKKLHLYRKILLFYAQNSYSVQDFIGKSTPFSHQFPLHIIIYIIQPHNIYNTTSQLPLPETSTSVARNLNFCHRVPSAARSDSVRHPIRFRSPSDWIPSAVRLDSVRHPTRFLYFYVNQSQYIHLNSKTLTTHFHYIHTLILGV